MAHTPLVRLPMKRLSVIIPVHDRRERLDACLASLAKCEGRSEEIEIIVVCDGGPASIREAASAWNGRWPLRWIDIAKSGPAAARNRAMREAQGEVFLFLNDDVELEPQCLVAHLRAHDREPGHAVAGHTRWHPRVVRTEFMHWASHHDHHYYLLTDSTKATWEFWHTLNASMHRRWFDEGELYDETFPDPAYEDTEYAYRLEKKGMRFLFAADAILYHDHFFTPVDYLRKSAMRGASARLFLKLHPELRERIVGEYETAVAKMRNRLLWREVTREPDGPAEWHARFGMAYLAGYRGSTVPWLARHCIGSD